jgi:hypothetical protein
LWGELEETDHVTDLGISGRIMYLTEIECEWKALKKCDRRVWAYGKKNNNLELMDMSTKLIIGFLAFGGTKSPQKPKPENVVKLNHQTCWNS